MKIPESFVFKLLHGSLNELGLSDSADKLVEEMKEKRVFLETTPMIGDPSNKSKVLEWFGTQLKEGNYGDVINYLDQLLSGTNKNGDSDLMAIIKPTSDVELTIYTMIYLIKRTVFLEKVVEFSLKNSDSGLNNNTLIQYLSDELTPLLDIINKSDKVSSALLSGFTNDIITNLNKESESSLLLSLVMNLPLSDTQIEPLIFNKNLLFISNFGPITNNTFNYYCGKLRQILIKHYFGNLFIPEIYESSLPYPNDNLPKYFLNKLIESSINYNRYHAPYYLTPRNVSFNDSNEDFIVPIESNMNDFYKPKFPIKLIHDLHLHGGQVWFAKFSPLGKYLITGSADGKLIIYDVLNNFEPLATLSSDNISDKMTFVNSTYKPSTASKAVIYCCWDHNEEYIVSGSLDTKVRVWYVGSIKNKKSSSSSSSPKRRITRSGSEEENNDDDVKLLTCFVLGEKIRTWSCEFLPQIPDDTTPQFIIGSPDKVLKAYDIYGTELFDFYGNTHENTNGGDVRMKDDDGEYEDGEGDVDKPLTGSSTMLSSLGARDDSNSEVKTGPDNFNRINDLSITPDGKILITANNNKQVDFYSIPNLTNVDSITKKVASINLNGRLTSCCVSKNGKYLLLSLAPDELQIWDIELLNEGANPILFKKLVGHSQSTYIIRSCFGYLDLNSNQEELVVSGSDDGDIYIWNLMTGRLVTRIKAHKGVCNSVDWNNGFIPTTKDYGKIWCSVGDDRVVKIWGPEDL